MSELLGMSFDSAASPAVHIRGWAGEESPGPPPTGWGVAWYPDGEEGAVVVKDPFPTGDTALSRVLRDWERFRGGVFLFHIRGAAKRARQENTHPFCRSYGGHDWLFAHNGELDADRLRAMSEGPEAVYEPVGRTDSERALCWLLNTIRAAGMRRLGDIGWPQLHRWMRELDALGTLNAIITDGHDLAAYRDEAGFNSLHFTRIAPPHRTTNLRNNVVEIDFGDPLDINRTMVLVATTPAEGAVWSPVERGELLVARNGAIVYRSSLSTATVDRPASRDRAIMGADPALDRPPLATGVLESPETPLDTMVEGRILSDTAGAFAPAVHSGQRRSSSERVLHVVHETEYRYRESVERSTHLLRLQPVHDLTQELLEHQLETSSTGELVEYEDVFGNRTKRMRIRRPYSTFRLVARSRVRVRRPRPVAPQARATSLPLVWMPWQRQMMQSYLLPPELPETQLRELSEFAMSFAERQDYDLLETLADMNETIRRDFLYETESTTLETTPFEVYVARRGVCQDFANLFICLSRLLGIPARYRVGYIYTGGNDANKIQSDRSHAWVEVYVPWTGWLGYDPTNGCLAELDHVRVAAGRNFRDATPTSGTIYKGGNGETLSVRVHVSVESDEAAGG